MEINVFHNPNITDEEVYQYLLKTKDDCFMNGKEWKRKRLIELKKEGKSWSSNNE